MCSLYLVNVIQTQKYAANANCHWSNYNEASERMHMYIWEMACDSSCLSVVDCYIPHHRLWPVNQQKVCAASKVYHAVNITNICVNINWRGIYGSTYSMPEGELWQIKNCVKGIDLQHSFFLATLTTVLQCVVYHN